jgi:hypothetical protein
MPDMDRIDFQLRGYMAIKHRVGPVTVAIQRTPLYTRYCLGVRELERDQRRRARALR